MSTNVGYRFLWTLEVQKDGTNWFYGTDPRVYAAGLNTYAASTGRRLDTIERTVTAGQTVTAWSTSDTSNFGLFLCEIISPVAGLLQVEWKGDSAEDDAATYNAGPFIAHGAPLIANSTSIIVNSDPAAHVAGPLAAVGAESGTVRQLRLKNPGTASVVARYGVLVN